LRLSGSGETEYYISLFMNAGSGNDLPLSPEGLVCREGGEDTSEHAIVNARLSNIGGDSIVNPESVDVAR
jgi:hypothetical protein